MDEIRKIQRQVELNPALKHPDAISLGNERTSLYKISPINELVFIKGDNDTGFTHINERHSYWSESFYWKSNENEEVKLDDPSKFDKGSIPIWDYVKIADTIFRSENLNAEKNKHPELFEMYSGYFEEDGHKTKFHLLLYKNTRIVHTLYPHAKKHNKKRVINYRRGKAKGDFRISPPGSTIAIPYYDSKDEVIYSFQIIKDFDKKTEEGIIVNHKEKGTLKLYERPLEIIVEFFKDIERMNCADLTEVEKVIKKTET